MFKIGNKYRGLSIIAYMLFVLFLLITAVWGGVFICSSALYGVVKARIYAKGFIGFFYPVYLYLFLGLPIACVFDIIANIVEK